MSQERTRDLAMWIAADVVGDAIYVLDVAWYKHRLMFMENGFWVRDRKKITRQYVKYGSFRYDLFALLPTGMLTLKRRNCFIYVEL